MEDPNLQKLDAPQARTEARHPPAEAGNGGRGAGDGYGSNLAVAEPHLLDYVKVLHKRRWTATTAFSGRLPGVVVYTFTATPIYQGKVTTAHRRREPERRRFQAGGGREPDAARLLPDPVQPAPEPHPRPPDARHAEALEPAPLRRRERPEGLQPHRRHRRRGLVGGAGLRPGAAATSAAADETVAQAGAIDRLLGSLSVDPVRNSRVVEVSFRSTDPRLAAEVANAQAKGFIQQSLEFKFLSLEGGDRLAGAAARRAAQEGRGERGRAAALPRAERRHLARGPAEHRRAEADRPQRGGDARQDRAHREGGALPAAPGAVGRQRGARHLPGHPHQHLHPAAEGAARGAPAAAGRAGRQARAAAPRHGQDRDGHPAGAGQDAGRGRRRSSSPCATSTCRPGRRRTAWWGRSRRRSGTRWGSTGRASSTACCSATWRATKQIYESLLQRAQGDGRLGRAQDQQHPGGGRGRGAARAGRARARG